MKNKITIIVILAIALAACKKADKYSGLTDQQVYGYAYLSDPFNITLDTPLPGQTIFINDKIDTSSYVLQTAADAAGRFVFSRPSTNDFVIFSHYVKNGIEYRGSVRVGAKDDKEIVLKILPIYQTGLNIHFQDASGGGLSNLSFRLYTNQSAATADVIKQSFLIGSADTYGNYRMFNINPGDYWVVAKDTIGTAVIGVNQKITVSTKQLNNEKITLK